MLVAKSVLPLPLSPWHAAQSIAYTFFAFSLAAGVDFDDASCGEAPDASVGVGVGAITKRITAERSRNGFSMVASSGAGVENRHLAAD
jgi:hypothetical protein